MIFFVSEETAGADVREDAEGFQKEIPRSPSFNRISRKYEVIESRHEFKPEI